MLHAVTTGCTHASQSLMLFLYGFSINVSDGCSIKAQAYGANALAQAKYGYLRLNGVAVWLGSYLGEHPNNRGVIMFVVDTSTCTVQQLRNYDTYSDIGAAARMRDYIQALSDGTVVVGVSCDEASSQLDAAEATLTGLGADVSDVGWRGAFVFLAEIGDPSKTVLDKELTETAAYERQPIITASLEGTLRSIVAELTSLELRSYFSMRSLCP